MWVELSGKLSFCLCLLLSVRLTWLSPFISCSLAFQGRWQLAESPDNKRNSKSMEAQRKRTLALSPWITKWWPDIICFPYLLRRRQTTTTLHSGSCPLKWLQGVSVAVSVVKQHFPPRTCKDSGQKLAFEGDMTGDGPGSQVLGL